MLEANTMIDKYVAPDYDKMINEINIATISFLQDDVKGIDKELMGLAMAIRTCMSSVEDWLNIYGEENQAKAVPNPKLEWVMHTSAHLYCAKEIIRKLHESLVSFDIIKIQDKTDIADKNTG